MCLFIFSYYMKTIYLIRHAEAEAYSKAGDIKRHLTTHGLESIEKTYKRLENFKPEFELILASHACRASETALQISSLSNFCTKKIINDARIYNAGIEDLLDILCELNDDVAKIVMVGHNPGLTDFVNLFITPKIVLPPFGIICLDFETDIWAKIHKSPCQKRFFIYPSKE